MTESEQTSNSSDATTQLPIPASTLTPEATSSFLATAGGHTVLVLGILLAIMTIVTIILLIIVIILCRIIKKKKRFIIDAQCPAADQLDLRMMTPRRTSYVAQNTDSDYNTQITSIKLVTLLIFHQISTEFPPNVESPLHVESNFHLLFKLT